MNVVVLDVDPRHGGTLESLGGLPKTLMSWSGRGDGGVHLYFKRPYGRLSDRNLQGIDLRDAGKHYVIAPPSHHPDTGLAYRWEVGEVAEMPRHLVEMLHVPDRVRAPRQQLSIDGSAGTDGDGLVRYVAKLAEGERNSGLFWAACRAEEDGLLDMIQEDLTGAGLATGLAASEVARTIESARRTAGGWQ